MARPVVATIIIWIFLIKAWVIAQGNDTRQHAPRANSGGARYDFIPSISDVNINLQGITITSIQYNPSRMFSDWVDKLFGPFGVHYEKNLPKVLAAVPLTVEEIENRQGKFFDNFEIPKEDLWPTCSFEMLGFTRLKVSDNEPFVVKQRYENPTVGEGQLFLLNTNISCYYRGTYENWRVETPFTEPNYLATFIYCPSLSQSLCSELSHSAPNDDDYELDSPDKPIRMELVIDLDKKRYRSKISYDMKPVLKVREQSLKSQQHNGPHMAVCLAIPYTSIDETKSLANGVLLYDWVRYYLKLGFYVMLYDRDGANYKHLFTSDHSLNKPINSILKRKLIYNNYTIRGILDPSRKGMKYDNTELTAASLKKESLETYESRQGRFEAQGHDKTATLSHCRFEAKAVLGIDIILVADFDEFLYCPVAKPTVKHQAQFIQRFIEHQKRLGFDQITFPQRLTANLSANMRDCIVEKAKSSKSVFSCFAAYEYYMGSHSVKSVHLTHDCPLTGYHHAVPMPDIPRLYDCIGNSKTVRNNPWRPFNPNLKGRECAFLHFSSNQGHYDHNIRKYNLTADDKVSMFQKLNEVHKLLQY